MTVMCRKCFEKPVVSYKTGLCFDCGPGLTSVSPQATVHCPECNGTGKEPAPKPWPSGYRPQRCSFCGGSGKSGPLGPLDPGPALPGFEPTQKKISNDVEFIQMLIEQLTSDVAAIRESGARLLGKFGLKAKVAVPALRETLNDPDADVRQAAADALKAIDPGAANQTGGA